TDTHTLSLHVAVPIWSSPWSSPGSTTRWRASWRSGSPRPGDGCCWGLGLVVRPGTRSGSHGFRARLDEDSCRAQKKGPHGIVGALLFGDIQRGHTPTVGVGGAVTVGSCVLPPPPQ